MAVGLAALQDPSLLSRLRDLARGRSRLIAVAAGAVALMSVTWGPGSGDTEMTGRTPDPITATPGSGRASEWSDVAGEYHDPSLSAEQVALFKSPGRVTYWLGTHEIQGIGPATPVGTQVELWATWEPPLIEEPGVQLLVRHAFVEKIVPSSSPDGPLELGLSVRRDDISDIVLAQRYGALTAVVVSEP